MVQLLHGRFSLNWVGVPLRLPGYHALAYGCAVLLILAGVAVNLPRWAAAGAWVLAAIFALAVLAVHLPHALALPRVWGQWQAVAESAAMAMGGVFAYQQGALRPAGLARLVFGACLLVFGASHFFYATFTASLVPSWLPPSRLFWAYATGVAQIAAGLAVLSGIWAGAAAVLLSVMYAGFGLLVHLPLLMAQPASSETWSENFINVILLGATLGLAEGLTARPRALPQA